MQTMGGYQKGKKCQLLQIRQREEHEKRRKNDGLGLDSYQYATEVHKPVLIPSPYSLGRPMDAIHIAADGGPHHKGDMNRKLVEEHGYHELPWPLQSGDLNIIENCWKTLKDALQARWNKEGMRPRSADDIFRDAQEEWDKIDQAKIDSWIDRVQERLQAVIDAKGGHIKW